MAPSNSSKPKNSMFGRAMGFLLILTLAATAAGCGTDETPYDLDHGAFDPTPTVTEQAPTAIPPTPTAPYIPPTQTGVTPFTEYFPVGFTEYVENILRNSTKISPPGESTYVEPGIVLVVVNPDENAGRTLYCAVDSYQNTQNPPFDVVQYPVGGGSTTTATTCLEGPRLVRVGENTYQIQVDPYGTIATVSLDDELAQSATPYVFAVNRDGFIGDQASGVVGNEFLRYADLGVLALGAEHNGPALVEGVQLVPTPVPEGQGRLPAPEPSGRVGYASKQAADEAGEYSF